MTADPTAGRSPIDTGYARLACAILFRAMLDAGTERRKFPSRANAARGWLLTDGLELADMVGIEPEVVRTWVKRGCRLNRRNLDRICKWDSTLGEQIAQEPDGDDDAN